ncbi:hypothetical protein QQS21_012697 [Conoideocrella luteorostrata]|uniref:Uncharacterized protein n=1 Tax=Conoideocrella luteorostrata TaxID=1105319 RepID=A0AAJ0CF86_9HYPO|nr:hypothetical protein QQS21_012697 [Conoideocrella luteorostrata]
MSTSNVFTRDSLFNLQGRVALVTGGGSGIGLMAAQALVANGAKVYITGRTREKLDRVMSAHFGSDGDKVIPLQVDTTSKDSIQSLVKEIEAREKHLCILINNAGISGDHQYPRGAKSAEDLRDRLFENSSFDTWTDLYRTNVAALYFTTAAFLPLLQASTDQHPGWSSIVVNITSISGLLKSAQNHFDYNASKGAAVHLTRMLASEIGFAGLRIRVNDIAPGVFPSEMTSGDSDETQKSQLPKSKLEGEIPAGRPGKDEDIASAILFTCCNQYLNGETIVVDGGYTLKAGK